VRAGGREVRLEGRAHACHLVVVQPVVGKRRAHQAGFEIRKVAEAHVGHEAHFARGLPECGAGSWCQGCVHRPLGGSAHHRFVVEEPHDVVEWAFVDRFRHIQVATRPQHACNFGQGAVHQRDGHVVQALEHQRQIEAGIGLRDGLCATGGKAQALLRLRQVLGKLAFVHLQRQAFAARVGQQQVAQQPGGTAAQFDDALAVQRHQFGQQVQFVVDAGQVVGHRWLAVKVRRATIAAGFPARPR
jgi:hypothetical protein